MPVSWTDDPTAFTSREWTRLVQADPEGTVFHSPRFLKLYWEEFGQGHLQLAFVDEGSEDVAAAALELRDDTLTWLGGFDLTDYMGPVGPPTSRERAAKELMVGLAVRDDWSQADLRGLPREGDWLRALQGAAEDVGLPSEVETDTVAPWLSLPSSYQEYLAGLPSKRRHELRRKERRLREALPDARVVTSDPDRVGRDLDRFVAWHRTSEGPKGRFMVPGMELFFRRLADELLSGGPFRLWLLEAEGEPIAGAVGFEDRDRILLYNSAFDHARARLAPGMVLVAMLVAQSIERGCVAVDMLKGDLEYKYRLGARPRELARLVLRPG
jgi:CelD/BcsL family acetyltransferase involved in cellulose biosynthesis